ncbi:MAG: hypothetical protein LBT92_01585 [Rickettsiales bacterium]|jgi:beta-phosphoglucomutase-like phosphatase (HAD superfamily)|nr:hypothetical protein [Rickettsiales bacterium]
MNIAVDCDNVILDTFPAMRDFYHDAIDSSAEINPLDHPDTWPVFGGDRSVWLKFLDDFNHSPYFVRPRPIEGAINGLRRIKSLGHGLYVLFAASKDKEVREARKAHMDAIAPALFSDVLCIDSDDESKGEVAARRGFGVLIDDSGKHIQSALDHGLSAIWLKRPANEKEFGEAAPRPGLFLAEGWDDVVETIAKADAVK